MSTNHQQLLALRHLWARRTPGDNKHRVWLRASLATTALALFVGCASNPGSRWSSHDKFDLHNSHEQTRHTQNYITQQARQRELPETYLSNVRIGMAEVEAKLDSARATELERDAILQERTADLNAEREETATRQQIALAEIEKLKKERKAKRDQLAAVLAAHKRSAHAEAEKKIRFREALAKERTTAQTDMISQAEQAFTKAKARTEQLQTAHTATERESLATIEKMRENVQATRTRAAATVTALRTEAQSKTEQAAARVTELQTQIGTIPQQAQAESSQLLVGAVTIEDESHAVAQEWEARADALEQQVAKHEYRLKVTRTKADWRQAQAVSDRQTTEAKTGYQQTISKIDRLHGDAHMMVQNAQSESTKEFQKLSAWFKDSTAEVDDIRSKFDQLEKVARAEFVKAEAKSRADALKETAQHQEALSEAKMNTIVAAAEAEAARLRKNIMVELASKTRAGRVGFDGKTAPTPQQPADLYDVPRVRKVVGVTPRFEPEAVAAFRSALAKVMHERTKADSQERALEASYNEGKSNLEFKRAEKIAAGNEQLARADALMLRAGAELKEHKAEIAAELAEAKSKYDRAFVEADTLRRDALAEAVNYQVKAKAVIEEGVAQITALRNEAEVVTQRAQTEVKSLQAELHATEQRGKGKASRLLAEADTIEQNGAGLAKQIEAQIVAAERTLEAELSQLDGSIKSAGVIAGADYAEAMVQAQTFGEKAESEIKRLESLEELEHAIAQAELQRIQDQHFVDVINDEVEIRRLLAVAQAERDQSDAFSDAELVAIRTDADKATANLIAQRRIAAARENAVKSRFDARLAQFDSSRFREKMGVFRTDSVDQMNVETTLAEAEAALAQTKERLALLVKRQKSLQQAAVKNWDARLVNYRETGFNDNND